LAGSYEPRTTALALTPLFKGCCTDLDVNPSFFGGTSQMQAAAETQGTSMIVEGSFCVSIMFGVYYHPALDANKNAEWKHLPRAFSPSVDSSA